jgi:glycopeptide antibiotics resistance protein
MRIPSPVKASLAGAEAGRPGICCEGREQGDRMTKRERIQTGVLYVVFIGYLVLLMKILFLSRVSILELFHGHRTVARSINLIPFYSIGGFLSGSSVHLKSFAFANVVGNILLFIPLGVYLTVVKNDKRVRVQLLFILMASVFAECIQGLLSIGTADIDDIILNCIGGWMGVLAYKCFLFILRDEKKVHTVITLLSVVVGVPVIFYYLFMIKMRF